MRHARIAYYAAHDADWLVTDQGAASELKRTNAGTDAITVAHHVMMTALHDGKNHVSSWLADRSSMSVGRVLAFVFGAFSAAMLGLAAGAVWMVAALYMRHPLPWLVLPLGALLAIAIRNFVRSPGSGAAVLAALATGLAAIYVNILIAAIQIAGSMGMGIVNALQTAGIGMLWQLARLAVSPTDIAWALLAMALAAWIAWRAPGKPNPGKP